MIKHKKGSLEADIPTASMPDIVFMLLIFFLVTTTFSTDKGIPLTLPEFSEDTESIRLPKDRLLNILIAEDGAIMVDEQVLSSQGELYNRVREALDAYGRDEEGKYKKIVSIKTQNGTMYEDYIFVLDRVKDAGATKISIAEPE